MGSGGGVELRDETHELVTLASVPHARLHDTEWDKYARGSLKASLGSFGEVGELTAHRSLGAASLLGGVTKRTALQLIRELHGTLRGDLRLRRLGRGCILPLVLLSLSLVLLTLRLVLLTLALFLDILLGLRHRFRRGRRFGRGLTARRPGFVLGNLRIRRGREDHTLGGDVEKHPLTHEVLGVVPGLLVLGRGQSHLLLPGSDGEVRQVRQVPRQQHAADLVPRRGYLLVAVRAPHQRHHRRHLTLVPHSINRAGLEAVALLEDANHRSTEHDRVVAGGVGPSREGCGAEHRRDESGKLEGHVGADDGVDEGATLVFLKPERPAHTDGHVAEPVDERLRVSLDEPPGALQRRPASQRVLLRRDRGPVPHPSL